MARVGIGHFAVAGVDDGVKQGHEHHLLVVSGEQTVELAHAVCRVVAELGYCAQQRA